MRQSVPFRLLADIKDEETDNAPNIQLDINIEHNNCFSVLLAEMRTSGQREYNRVPKQINI